MKTWITEVGNKHDGTQDMHNQLGQFLNQVTCFEYYLTTVGEQYIQNI